MLFSFHNITKWSLWSVPSVVSHQALLKTRKKFHVCFIVSVCHFAINLAVWTHATLCHIKTNPASFSLSYELQSHFFHFICIFLPFLSLDFILADHLSSRKPYQAERRQGGASMYFSLYFSLSLKMSSTDSNIEAVGIRNSCPNRFFLYSFPDNCTMCLLSLQHGGMR